MRKVFLSSILVALMFITGCVQNPQIEFPSESNAEEIQYKTATPTEEMRAVWLTCYELSMQAEKGGTKESFTNKISKMFDNIVALGLNTVIVHVRPFSDAFYPSEIFPISKFLTGTQGGKIDYDPLLIMTQEAKKRKLEIHAWINPYRVSYSSDFNQLSAENPARKWHEDDLKENDNWIMVYDGGIYYNPAVPEVQKMIIDGVREIVRNYDINAIHMDDYFYPTTSPDIDNDTYKQYAEQGGKKILMEWRRENVNSFISGLYSAIKAIKSEVELGISPAGNIKTNYEKLGADVYEWGSAEGYIDYLMPQVYFGFENETSPFTQTCNAWVDLVKSEKIKLCFGLALYKSGTEDEYAGSASELKDTPRYEWINNSDIISRQIKQIRTSKRYDGFALYSYNYLFSDNATENIKKELENFKSML